MLEEKAKIDRKTNPRQFGLMLMLKDLDIANANLAVGFSSDRESQTVCLGTWVCQCQIISMLRRLSSWVCLKDCLKVRTIPRCSFHDSSNPSTWRNLIPHGSSNNTTLDWSFLFSIHQQSLPFVMIYEFIPPQERLIKTTQHRYKQKFNLPTSPTPFVPSHPVNFAWNIYWKKQRQRKKTFHAPP